jgi:hypothetical protein
MKHTFVIRDEHIRGNALKVIEALPLDPINEIIIREHHKDRTIDQNSLYWMWLTLIAGELGETKDSMHHEYKKKFLVHIFERDDPEYAAMIKAVRDVYKIGMEKEASLLADQIVKLTSTTDANVKQFTEYLNDIEHDAISEKRIVLPHPEDKYNFAMGTK